MADEEKAPDPPRYGDQIQAWLAELEYGWYDQGGTLPPWITWTPHTDG